MDKEHGGRKGEREGEDMEKEVSQTERCLTVKILWSGSKFEL